MSKVVVYERKFGDIEILRPAIKKPDNIDEESFLKVVAEKTFPNRPFKITNDKRISIGPFDLTKEFRSALVLKNNEISIDVEKAKTIWVKKIREHRDNVLKDLDVEFMKAMEDNDMEAVAEIGELKKMLRDIPQQFLQKEFRDIFEIKGYWPDLLQPAPKFVYKR